MTLEQLIEEIRKSEELRKELAEAAAGGNVEAFLRAHGCDATVKEAKAYLLEKAEEFRESGELTPEELEEAAGGTDPFLIAGTVFLTYEAVNLGIGIYNEIKEC